MVLSEVMERKTQAIAMVGVAGGDDDGYRWCDEAASCIGRR